MDSVKAYSIKCFWQIKEQVVNDVSVIYVRENQHHLQIALHISWISPQILKPQCESDNFLWGRWKQQWLAAVHHPSYTSDSPVAAPSNMQTGWLVACKYNALSALGSEKMIDRAAYEMGCLPARGTLPHITRLALRLPWTLLQQTSLLLMIHSGPFPMPKIPQSLHILLSVLMDKLITFDLQVIVGLSVSRWGLTFIVAGGAGNQRRCVTSSWWGASKIDGSPAFSTYNRLLYLQ